MFQKGCGEKEFCGIYDNKNMTNKIFYIACVVAVIVILGLGLGYRIQPNLSISKNASLTLNIPLKNTEE